MGRAARFDGGRRDWIAGAAAVLSTALLPRATAAQGEDVLPAFVLTDHNGRRRRLADFRGKVVVVSFGYTQCPDVCPTTLAVHAQALRDLGADAARVQVLFVTVDPERDTQAVLARYVPAFDASMLALRGDAQSTARAADAFGVVWEKHKRPQGYVVDHTAASFIVDAQGRLRVVIAYGRGPDAFVRDIRRLVAESASR